MTFGEDALSLFWSFYLCVDFLLKEVVFFGICIWHCILWALNSGFINNTLKSGQWSTTVILNHRVMVQPGTINATQRVKTKIQFCICGPRDYMDYQLKTTVATTTICINTVQMKTKKHSIDWLTAQMCGCLAGTVHYIIVEGMKVTAPHVHLCSF